MDLLALAVALAAFVAIYVAIDLLERVWAPPTRSSSRSRWRSSSTSRSRCCAASGS